MLEPTDALSPEKLMVPKGIEFSRELAQGETVHASNFWSRLDHVYTAHPEKVSSVVCKSIAELTKPTCPQVALYGSYTLEVDFVWSHVASIKAAPLKRGYVRTMEDGCFCMKGATWPFLGVPGAYTVVKGTCAFALISANTLKEVTDIPQHLAGLEDRDALTSERVVLAAQGSAVWVPFGMIAIIMGVPPDRSTKALVEEQYKPKKRGRKQESVKSGDKTYSAVSFLPFISRGMDTAIEKDAHAIQLVAGTLLFNSNKLPKSLTEMEDWKAWVLKLQELAKDSSEVTATGGNPSSSANASAAVLEAEEEKA